jgi:hypothetical protein
MLMAAPASAAVLYDHTPSVVGFHATVQDFEASLDANDAQVADDFRVPAGEVWIVQRAFVDGRKPGDAGPGVPEFVHAFLFGPQGSLPAASPFYSRQLDPAPGTPYPDFDLALPGVPLLPAGTWWFAAQPRMDFDAPDDNYWFWGTIPSKVGNGAAYRNPGDGFGSGCTSFAPMVGCVTNVGNPDVAFRLEGIRINGRLAVTRSKALRRGRLRVTVNAPNVGTLTIRSNLMKPVTRELTKLGELTLVLKPKGGAKRKLARGLRPRAKLTLDGLDPYFDGTEVPRGTFRKRLKP